MANNNLSPGQSERRNYYRILNVQPDAPIEIIRNNYRTLLQKLRMHPDLGSQHWNASAITEAYNVLPDTDKRAAYDKRLLKQYDLNALSRGHLTKPSFGANQNKDHHGNQRNFYRLFNVQPDSPSSIIKTSYLTLSKNKDVQNELLKEAYSVLSNIEKRKLYDRLLSKYSHADALKKLSNRKLSVNKNRASTTQLFKHKMALPLQLNRLKASREYGKNNRHDYLPVITQYCSFCKTPHDQSPCKDTAPFCNECKSPLFPPSTAFLSNADSRNLVRITQNSTIGFYTFWPGKKYHGSLLDISPTGIQLRSPIKLEKDTIIKLDGDNFKAVGQVSYQNVDAGYVAGIQFLTINFDHHKGQFLSESA